MGWLGILVFLCFPWILSYILGRSGVPIDFWIPLMLTVSFFSIVFNEIKTNTLTMVYKFYNRYKIVGVGPKLLARHVLDDNGFNKLRVDTTAIGYFTFGDTSADSGGALELAPEIYEPFGNSEASGESGRGQLYSAGAYGLLFRRMGMSVYAHRPGVVMFFKRLVGIPANIAGFVYIFPLTFGYAFFGKMPALQKLLITGGLVLLGIVILYIAILIPYELVVGRISHKLLNTVSIFDRQEAGLIRRFIYNYRRLVIILTLLNIFAIFVPITRGEK